jgi:hypothetical protein
MALDWAQPTAPRRCTTSRLCRNSAWASAVAAVGSRRADPGPRTGQDGDRGRGPAAVLGDLLGSLRDAVQPGRRIATLRREAGLGPAIAFMTPGAGAA